MLYTLLKDCVLPPVAIVEGAQQVSSAAGSSGRQQ